ncbi:MAG: efflux RND transporter permease subunit [Bacteroidota bacterium]|nr:efflux RND transporter permease subunit [Bacteroidota bacterium]
MKFDFTKVKEFKPTSWSIDNKTSIYVLTLIIVIFGLVNYNTIPKEQIPEIVIPTIIVSTVYPGTSPSDMENLVTRPIEKNIKSINGVKKVTSNSVQDFSSIVVEFNTGIAVSDAKQKVKDAVDKSRNDLPNNLPNEPNVMDVDFSEFPIMYINLSGDFEMDKLKKYADDVKDKIEALPEITRVDIVGALDREIQINVDMYKMQVAGVALSDIERAVASENVTISGGSIDMQGMKRSIRVVGEFKDMDVIRNIVMKSSSGAIVYLKDIAEVNDTYKERESFARLNGKNVITLNVIKKSGQNLIEASDKIDLLLKELKLTKLPEKLNINITANQSVRTKSLLNELNNTIIIGFILVTIVLMFFMGFTNAFFVGLSVPLSMCLTYIVMPEIGFTMNMLVMFAFIFALGIVVDDAIVVIENTHRIFYQNKGKMDITQSAKVAAGEVFIPILSGTLTTLAPFFPLAFWPGIVGKFMYFIPVTLIITLFSSLIVAYIFNPVFAVSFMTHTDEDDAVIVDKKKLFKNTGIIAAFGILLHIMSFRGLGNFVLFVAVSYVLHNLWGANFFLKFQHNFIPRLINKYQKLVAYILAKKRPYFLFFGVIGLLIITFILTAIIKPKVVFFPTSDPQYIYAYISMPVGTSLDVTDSVTKVVENRINNVIGKNNPIVESVIANVALGAGDPYDHETNIASHKGRIQIEFVEYSKRHGVSTQIYLDRIRDAVKGITGAEITVEQNRNGPPTGKPVNIEISGENLDELIANADAFKKYIVSLNIPGIEELKSDFQSSKPEILVNIDRERANIEGITTGQVGMELRTAIFGKEISKYKDAEDQYPIQLRYGETERKSIDKLLGLKITYRDMNTGLLRQIPLSSIAKVDYSNSYGGIKRKNLKRVITLYSNVLSGYTPNEIVNQINAAIPDFKKSEGIEINLTGEREDQNDASSFLSKSMLLTLCLIFFILITQFNSISKPLIILSEVIFSIIGVLIGFDIFGMPISIIMTGMGVVALGGIVVRNGILLVEFTDKLKAQGYKTRDAIIMGGKTRITPVLLTASATILGLIPLAIGFNINFVTLFTELNPHIHFGGDNAQFFGSLAWSIIFGLSFATFLTLLLIPAMYYIAYVSKYKVSRKRLRRKILSGKQI